MTKQDLIAELNDIARTSNGDPEIAHSLADDALLSFINDDGVSAAFELIEKWYA